MRVGIASNRRSARFGEDLSSLVHTARHAMEAKVTPTVKFGLCYILDVY